MLQGLKIQDNIIRATHTKNIIVWVLYKVYVNTNKKKTKNQRKHNSK